MSMDLFHKIIDEVVTIPEIDMVDFSGIGEPLLDSHIIDRIRYISERSSIRTQLATNGLLLMPYVHDMLRDAGLYNLNISLNANNPTQHEQITGMKGKFDLVVQNAVHAIRSGKYTSVSAVITDGFTEEDAKAFVDTWGKSAHYRKEVRVDSGPPNPMCCWRALCEIYVMYDGTVTPCCFDVFGRQRFGNLNDKTLREIYNGPEYLRFREAHNDNQADRYVVCQRCPR